MSLSEAVDPFEECPVFKILYSEGDELPEITGVLEDFDLTGSTVQMNLQRPADVLIKAAAFVDPPNGVFKFAWISTDLVAGLGQLAVIRIFDPSAKSETLAIFQLDVRRIPT